MVGYEVCLTPKPACLLLCRTPAAFPNAIVLLAGRGSMKSASQASLKTNLGHETQLKGSKGIQSRGAQGYDPRHGRDLAAVPSRTRSRGSSSGPPLKEHFRCAAKGLTAAVEPAQPRLRDVRAKGHRRQQQIRRLEEHREIMWQGGITSEQGLNRVSQVHLSPPGG